MFHKSSLITLLIAIHFCCFYQSCVAEAVRRLTQGVNPPRKSQSHTRPGFRDNDIGDEDEDNEVESGSRHGKRGTDMSSGTIMITLIRILRSLVPPLDIVTFGIMAFSIFATTVSVLAINGLSVLALVTAHPAMKKFLPHVLEALGMNPDSVDAVIDSLTGSLAATGDQLGLGPLPQVILSSIVKTWVQSFASTLSQAAIDNYQ